MSKIERAVSLKEQILNILRKDIIKGNIKPGEQIIESELARSFGVSRGPVREALIILANEGFISKNDSGIFFVTVLTKQDVYEIYSLRSIIEGFAAREAVVKFTSEDLNFLDRCIKNIAELKDSFDQVIAVPNTLEIHHFVIKKSGHKRILDLWTNLSMQLKMFGSVVMMHDTLYGTLVKHTDLVETLKKQEPELAEKTMRDHIMEAWEIADRQLINQDDIQGNEQ
ncbi:MAG: GntR family transcriptional regulator [Peptococcaceae bacterium]